jgi:DNA replication protein DnaC
MLRQRGYPGSAVQVSRAVRHLRPAPPSQAYLRLSTLAGKSRKSIGAALARRFSCAITSGSKAAMRSSRLPAVKQLRDFRLHVSALVRREQIESLRELGFVERRENAIFLRPPGVGKTHLAIRLAIAAAHSGRPRADWHQ